MSKKTQEEILGLEKGNKFTPDWDKISKIGDSVLPVVIQHARNKKVLGVMYMNKEAYEHSCGTRLLTLYSTSIKKLWVKGEENGETFQIISIYTNCEQNSLLCLVIPNRNGICHVKDADSKPEDSCFYRKISINHPYILNHFHRSHH